MLLHGSKEAKMPSFITIAICGGYIHKMTGLVCWYTLKAIFPSILWILRNRSCHWIQHVLKHMDQETKRRWHCTKSLVDIACMLCAGLH